MSIILLLFLATIASACDELPFIGNYTSECIGSAWHLTGRIYANPDTYGYAVLYDNLIINGTLFNPSNLILYSHISMTIYGRLINTGTITTYPSNRPAISVYGFVSWDGINQTTPSIVLYHPEGASRNYYLACVNGPSTGPNVVDYYRKHWTTARVDHRDDNCTGTILYYRLKYVETAAEKTSRILLIIAIIIVVLLLLLVCLQPILYRFYNKILRSNNNNNNNVRQP